MAQCVWMLHKHEVQISDPSTHIKKSGHNLVYDYNTSTVEGRDRRNQPPKLQGLWKTLLKGIRMTVTDQDISVLFGNSPTQESMLSHM